MHAQPHEQDVVHQPAVERPAGQYAIIMPTKVPMPRAKKGKSRDLDMTDNRLLPALSQAEWPTPAVLADAQREATLRSPTFVDVGGEQLSTDARGRILLPTPTGHRGCIVDIIIIVAAHQGDWFHRSSDATAATFLRQFTIFGHTDTVSKVHIITRCRGCLSCIKLRTGGSVPRPLWYLVRATRPFEYLHLDFLEMPLAAFGNCWLLVVVDDLSLTTLLHPCRRCTAMKVVAALVNEWLSHYPNPVLLHTDGGTHFDNAIVRGLARVSGWRHTLSTAYAKRTHAVAERANEEVLQIIRPLCRQLGKPVNMWDTFIKQVQKDMQRKRRKSRRHYLPTASTFIWQR